MSAVNDMTWREFHLRKQGWEREQLRKWEHTRMVAYWSGAGTAFDAGKTKIDRFMPLDKETNKPIISESHKARFNEEMKKYLDKVKNGSSK